QVKIADVKFISGTIKFGLVSRINSTGQTKLRIIRNAQGIVIIVRFDYRENGSEDFFLLDRRTRFHIGDDRRLDEKALFAISAATRNYAAAFSLAFLNVFVDRLESLRIDYGAHRIRTISSRAHFDSGGAFGNPFNHRVINPSVNDRARTGRTLLSLKAEGRLDYACCSFVKVRIIRDDNRVLAAHFGHHTFNPKLTRLRLRGALVDAQAYFLRSCEGNEAR